MGICKRSQNAEIGNWKLEKNDKQVILINLNEVRMKLKIPKANRGILTTV